MHIAITRTLDFLGNVAESTFIIVLFVVIVPASERLSAISRKLVEQRRRLSPYLALPQLNLSSYLRLPYLDLPSRPPLTGSPAWKPGDLESLAHLPPELLQLIFAHYCGDNNYIDVFGHVCVALSTGHKASGHTPTFNDPATTLMAVCRTWEALTKRTPELWRSLCLDTSTLPPGYDKSLVEDHSSIKNCKIILEGGILARSRGLTLRIRLQGRNRAPFQEFLDILMRSSDRWASLELACDDCMYFKLYPTPRCLRPFRNLRSITIEKSNFDIVYSYPKFTISECSPELHKVVLRELGNHSGTHHYDAGRPLFKKLMLKWDGITTLVMSTPHFPLASSITLALQTMQHNLLHLEWHGTSKAIQGRSSVQVELPRLRSLVIAEPAPSWGSVGFCNPILLNLSCPSLESFNLILSRAEEKPYAHNPGLNFLPARAGIEHILGTSPHLQQVTIVLTPNSVGHLDSESDTWRTCRSLFVTGTQSQLKDQVEYSRALDKPTGHMKRMLARVLSFAPPMGDQHSTHSDGVHPHSAIIPSDAEAWACAQVHSMATTSSSQFGSLDEIPSDETPNDVDDTVLVLTALDGADEATIHLMVDLLDMMTAADERKFPSASTITMASMV